MNRHFSIACVAACLMGAAPAAAQTALTERPTIIVTGSGQAEAQPDQFKVAISIEGRGATQIDAMRALSAAQDRMIGSLPTLDNLTRSRLTTGHINVEPRFSPECGTGDYDRDTSDCPVVGYSVHSQLEFRGSPAERAGDAISLASELGAVEARLRDYDLVDRRQLQETAYRNAFADAESQAGMLADASGRRIVRILRIQDPSARVGIEELLNELPQVVVTGSRIRSPAISVTVAPAPVTATARVTVVFEIE